MHDNALFEFRPIEYVADPQVVAQNYKMASLTQALVIDLTGEVCADQFHGEYYSGVSTQLDFHRGAARSLEGKPPHVGGGCLYALLPERQRAFL